MGFSYHNGELIEETAAIMVDTIIIPPSIVSARQMRIALHRLNMLSDVEIFVTNSSDQEVKIAWEYATEFRRDDLMVQGTQLALSKTDKEMDDLFTLAATL